MESRRCAAAENSIGRRSRQVSSRHGHAFLEAATGEYLLKPANVSQGSRQSLPVPWKNLAWRFAVDWSRFRPSTPFLATDQSSACLLYKALLSVCLQLCIRCD